MAKATFTIALGKAKLATEARSKTKSMVARWAKVPGAESYQLQWRERGGKWKTKAARSTKATVKGLKPGKKAWVQVRAFRKAGSATYGGILTASSKSFVRVAGKSVKAQSAAGSLTAAAF